ncbi:hypothetical protein H9P43_003622 [Blastocladiella emersonii ATCC 22665]|nr:hypothetical protein H9P43_003622 [Blastocladiella emersonii ATCC 22665]
MADATPTATATTASTASSSAAPSPSVSATTPTLAPTTSSTPTLQQPPPPAATATEVPRLIVDLTAPSPLFALPVAENRLPIYGVCEVKPANARLPNQSVRPCPIPEDRAFERLAQCQQRECAKIGITAISRIDLLSKTMVEQMAALEDCSIAKCPDEFAGVAANICLPLRSDRLRAVGAYLPSLPPGADPAVFGPLLDKHLAAVGRREPLSNPPANELGICVPTMPVGMPCTTKELDVLGYPKEGRTVNRRGNTTRLTKAYILQAVPREFEEAQAAAATSTATTTKAIYAEPTDVALDDRSPVPYVLRGGAGKPEFALATFGSTIRILNPANMYALVYCAVSPQSPSNGVYAATAEAGGACTTIAGCRYGSCASGRCESWTNRAPGFALSDEFPISVDPRSRSLPLGNVLFLVVLIAIYLIAVYSRPIIKFFLGFNRKMSGAIRTTQRELALQPVSGAMLEPLERARYRRTASGAIHVTAGREDTVDELPRYMPVDAPLESQLAPIVETPPASLEVAPAAEGEARAVSPAAEVDLGDQDAPAYFSAPRRVARTPSSSSVAAPPSESEPRPSEAPTSAAGPAPAAAAVAPARESAPPA